MDLIYATNEQGETRGFSKMVWENIPPACGPDGVLIPKGGWKLSIDPAKVPDAVKEAEANAKAKTEAQPVIDAVFIAKTEEKIKEGKTLDFKTELKPYLEQVGLFKDLGGKPVPEIMKELQGLIK